PLMKLPGGIISHQTTGVNLSRSVGYPPLNRLSLCERHTECSSLRSVIANHIQRTLSDPNAPGSHFEPSCRQPNLHRSEPVAFLSEEFRLRQPAIFESYFVSRGSSDHRNSAQYIEARRAFVHEECGYSTAHSLCRIGDCHHNRKIGFSGAAKPDFSSVEHPFAVFFNSACGHSRWIGTSA